MCELRGERSDRIDQLLVGKNGIKYTSERRRGRSFRIVLVLSVRMVLEIDGGWDRQGLTHQLDQSQRKKKYQLLIKTTKITKFSQDSGKKLRVSCLSLVVVSGKKNIEHPQKSILINVYMGFNGVGD